MIAWYKGQCYSDSIHDAIRYYLSLKSNVFIIKVDDTNLQQEKFNKEDIINIYSMKEIEHLLMLA